MSTVAIGLICLGIFVVLLFTSMPVFVAMLLSGILGICLILNPIAAFSIISADIFNSFSSYTMAVVPLFALMGYMANYTGIGGQLFKSADKFIGHYRGGLAMATDVACAVFGAICGSVPATIATIGSIAYPEMKKYGYKDSLAGGIIAAGSSLSLLIPPSVMLVVYGIATETSVGRLFAGGIVPGIILCIFFAIAIAIWAKIDPEVASVSPKSTWKERWVTLKGGGIIEVFIVFALSIGGLFIGWFTPSEAGAVGAAGILLIGIIEKKLSFKNFMQSMYETARLSAMVFILIAAATIFGRLFTLSRIPVVLGDFVTAINAPSWVIMLVILLIYLIAGCFIDIFSTILVTIPIFFPIIKNTLGYDPVWFCVVAVLILSMGNLTPPVGMNVFMTKGILKEPALGALFRGVVPFLICEVVLTLILIFIPNIVTWLPTVLYG